jgi:hypothetical protein
MHSNDFEVQLYSQYFLQAGYQGISLILLFLYPTLLSISFYACMCLEFTIRSFGLVHLLGCSHWHL